MDYSAGEIADRLSIVRLKVERMPDGQAVFGEEYGVFQTEWDKLVLRGGSASDRVFEKAMEVFKSLHELNGRIWDLESDTRMGKEGQLGLGEVGRRAIAIRDLNDIRVTRKNELNAMFHSGFQEIKSTWGDV